MRLGRWEPLGRKDWIEKYYDSVGQLRQTLADCGIAAVSSFAFNPAEPIFEEGAFGLSVLNAADHSRILRTLSQCADVLPELGGDTLVVRALPNWSADQVVSSDTIHAAANCWYAAGRMTAERGVRLSLNFDCVTMARTALDIELLLNACDPTLVGLSIDTADATIMGLDPLHLYSQFRERVWHVQLKNTRYIDVLDEYKLPFPEKSMLLGGGKREIDRWYCELGDEHGLVNVEQFYGALLRNGYEGWIVVESDQSPMPAASTMLNSWFVQNRLARVRA